LGGLLGALGLGGAAQAYNVAIGADQGTIGWSTPFLAERMGAALLRYLAIAHFGRGRGDWVEGEYPPHWRALVEEETARQESALAAVWDRAAGGGGREEIAALLHPIVTDAARRLLVRLYPDARPLLLPETRGI
jgi:hypothetical protein